MAATILVVEDNDKNRRLIKDVLEYHGYRIIEEANGAEGARLAGERKPELILMDIQMPVMDGMTAARILKNDPETKNIRLIALTSFVMKGDKERFLEAGFDDYIAKPINTKKLSEIVKKYLAGGDGLKDRKRLLRNDNQPRCCICSLEINHFVAPQTEMQSRIAGRSALSKRAPQGALTARPPAFAGRR